MAFRNQLIKDLGVQLVVGSVQESIDEGAVAEETGINASRNALQTTTLLDTIERNNFDACMGGARRDEEKARAKERFFSHRDDFGQWDPKTSVQSFGTCSTARSAWEKTSAYSLSLTGRRMDVWQYILQENIAIPELYFAKERNVIWRHGSWLPMSEFITLREGRRATNENGALPYSWGHHHHRRTGKRRGYSRKNCSGSGLFSSNGARNREDDKRSESAMEDRKRQGYF